MEPKNDQNAVGEREADALIARYGKKPEPSSREKLVAALEKERQKFIKLEKMKAEERNRQRGLNR